MTPATVMPEETATGATVSTAATAINGNTMSGRAKRKSRFMDNNLASSKM